MLRSVLRIGVLTALVGLTVGLGFGGWQYTRTKHIRQSLYDAFEPVAVTNCELKRFGDANDGGYLMCGNLLTGTEVAYSYGINGADNWGCQVSQTLTVPVHQYDCFNTAVPGCPGGDARFHAECVGPGRSVFEGRPFDTIVNQVARNGDAGKRIVMKMDVEGSEWESLLKAPDAVLSEIDQMAVEFHEVEKPAFLATIERMKQLFHVAHVHMNNYMCEPGFDPFPGQVFEVLFVSKRLGQIDPSVNARGPSPLDAPNTPVLADCQASPSGAEITRISRWTRRRLGVWYAGWSNTWKDRLLPPY
jgi:hypothetical protein